MVNNTDGTYSYSTTVTRKGSVIVSVFKYIPGGAQFEYYSNKYWTGTPDLIQTELGINLNYESGILYSTNSENVSIKIYFRIKSPFTGFINFQLKSNTQANLDID